jgi:hypothetical protein
VIAVFAVVLLGALVAGLMATVDSGDGSALQSSGSTATTVKGGAGTPTTAKPGTGAAPSTTGTTAAPSSAMNKAIEDAIAFVEKTRGLKFKTHPTVTVVDDAAFTKRYLEITERDVAENKQSYDDATAILHSVGLLPTAITYAEASAAFGSAGVLGFYDPETNELLVRGGSVTPLVRTIIVHELTHAVDDQWFELYRPELDDRKDEMGWTFTALAEGDARWVEDAYRKQLSNADRASINRDETALSQDVPIQKVGLPFIQLQLLPYGIGEAFVQNIRDNGGQAALDKVFTDLPQSSEQILRPAKYRNRDVPTVVAEPPADGTKIDSGVVGEAIWQLLFNGLGTTSKVDKATEGWKGDNSVAWTVGSKSCLRSDVLFDTSTDADEFASLAKLWSRGRPAGNADKTDTTTVRVLTCSS